MKYGVLSTKYQKVQSRKYKERGKNMPKMKTHRGAAKRIKVTGTGKFKRHHAYKSHILGKKSPKRKRGLRKSAIVSPANHHNTRELLPYL